MLKLRLLAGAAALMMSSVIAAPAWSAECAVGSVASYIALGAAGCNVGPMTFSNINVTPTVSQGGGATITLGNFIPFISAGEFGLTLGYSALAFAPGATADILWTYDVTGVPFISDAFLQLTGNTEGSGRAVVNEQLSPNGQFLSLSAPGSTTITFPPISSLHVTKDQIDFVGLTAGFSTTSALTNAFSVPGPVVGAGLPGLVAACGGLLGLARRRRKQIA